MWALSNLCRGKNPPPDFTKVISQDKHVSMVTAHLYMPYLFFRGHTLLSVYPHWETDPLNLIPTCVLPPHGSNLFFFQVSPCLSVLSWLLFVNDTDILADACWALSYLSDGPNDKIQAVIDSGVCRRLVELLM